MKKLNMMVAFAIGGGALSSVTLGAGASVAQTRDAAATAVGNGPPAASNPPENTVGEVVVTAQRRSESLTKVPIAIAVESREALKNAGVNDVAELQQIVPGFTMTASGANAQPSIRGVGSQVAGPGLSANVATYIDGFYQPNEITNNVQFNDVSSIEVLKGPQGTLYGRNATGGAVLITTRSPAFTPTADLDVSYGNFGNTKLALFATGPITDTLAGSISLLSDHGDGYTKNIYTGDTEGDHTTDAIRAKLLYRPIKALSFELGVKSVYVDDPNNFLYTNYKGETDGALFPDTVVATQPNQVATNTPALFHSHTIGGNLKTTFDLPEVTFTSYTSAEWQHNETAYDVDGSSAQLESLYFPAKDKTFQEELDISSKSGGRLTWVGGVFLLDDKGIYYINLAGPPIIPIEFGSVETKSVAVFGEATYRVVSNLYLTAGLRYSHDDLTENYTKAAPPPAPQPPIGTSFDAATPRVVLRYDLSDRSSVYASFNEGYKSGAFNALGLSPTPIKPETIDAYEVGYKMSTPKLNLNVAAFYYDYTNLQVSTYQGTVTILTNAASATVYGFDGHAGYEILKGLTLDAGFAYVHARYDSFDDAPHYQWSPVTGISISAGNASGNPLVNSPDFSGQIGLTYERSLPMGSAEFNANYSYQTVTYYDSFKETSQPAYGLLNLRASWYSPGRGWGVHLFARNLTDEHYVQTIIQQPVAFSALYASPRTYGVEVTVHL